MSNNDYNFSSDSGGNDNGSGGNNSQPPRPNGFGFSNVLVAFFLGTGVFLLLAGGDNTVAGGCILLGCTILAWQLYSLLTNRR